MRLTKAVTFAMQAFKVISNSPILYTFRHFNNNPSHRILLLNSFRNTFAIKNFERDAKSFGSNKM